MKKSVIAIDGPAGAGKSTIAKMAAKKLNYIYIDTGAMYRGVAWLVLQKYQVPVNTAQVLSVIEDINIRLAYDDNGNMLIFVNEQDVSTEIRTPEVTALVSQVAAISEVRQKMVELQRKMAQDGSVLMDGRDIGTCVLPNADLKIYLTASADERANRRAKEMREKGYDVDVEEIKKEFESSLDLFGEAWDDSVYESNIIFASLAYLLNLDDGKLNIIKNKLRKSETYDSLLDFILIGNKSEFDTSKISFPRPYKKLVKSINDEDRDAFLKYLRGWYKGSVDSAWYGTHELVNKYQYYGYWCFEAGAIAKRLGFIDDDLKNEQYYPYDMVHFV